MGLRCIEDNVRNKDEILLNSLFYNFREELGASLLEEIKDIPTAVSLFYEKMILDSFKWVIKTNDSKYVNNFVDVENFMTLTKKTLENSVVTINYKIPEIKSAEEVMKEYILRIKN